MADYYLIIFRQFISSSYYYYYYYYLGGTISNAGLKKKYINNVGFNNFISLNVQSSLPLLLRKIGPSLYICKIFLFIFL